jgi:hypothetical protein
LALVVGPRQDALLLPRPKIPYQVLPDLVADLRAIYPDEYGFLARYTDLNQPVFYGPRFRNRP